MLHAHTRHRHLLLSKRQSRARKIALHDTSVSFLFHRRYLYTVAKKLTNERPSETDATKAIAAVSSTFSPCNATIPKPTSDFTNKDMTITTKASATRNIFRDEMSAASSCFPSVWEGAVIIFSPPYASPH